MALLDQYIKEIEKELTIKPKTKMSADEIGEVIEIKDEVITLSGLDNVAYGELIRFDNGVWAMVIDMLPAEVGAIVLGDYLKIKSGDIAKATGNTLSIPVSDDLLGRVVNPLAEPLDKASKIKSVKMNPIEKVAPGVIYRKQVSESLQTGIKSVDALVAIGRGQREIIIGDRGVGKTTIALDTILNQKGQNVVCIYCAIGQKNSKVANTIELLRTHEALPYSIVVSASASDPATMQYLAPYSACAIAEYFMDKGQDVLIVYDDLSKHAWAYRQISLILRRPAGREAYPGDVFYLHSRLLERAARRDEKYGGGSITALPIVETLEGDVSAYIPTNIISITDGQIVLDGDLFNAGMRPAINVGLSVSRVGGAAQAKAMKQVAGKLKLDLAQYRELSAFSQFESDLDPETKKFLNRGAKITQILKQDKHNTYDLASEVAIIWAATKGYLDELTIPQVEEFEKKYLEDLQLRGKSLLKRINEKRILEEKEEQELKKFVTDNLPSPEVTSSIDQHESSDSPKKN
ncbi:F0F1 ATP synthase subunit alpha [Candidatus Roizmanbacteria bacterium RIFCSPHIGHO2_12_FULL_41_11]|uniref:ATP synthase subunit alpha n=1 Tax=Candidatus Roizmanbacteria bacterium RIFCSPHIGHO2_12_FULL_41_11 TaxID=1802052 RepID=A0A1F7I468_9BACT|nr:MAG: F0F1 ATP synthase subunit alpha [Candidatus Roizmanbacteria bacterium RIFCSPHIGHO2_12_FULL_41_11]